MTQSQREVAHFGGWSDKGIVEADTGDSVREWGDPLVRNVEITPQFVSIAGSVTLRLPEASRATVGAEYNVFAFNEDVAKATSLNVARHDGVFIRQFSPGGFAGQGMAMTFVNTGSGWIVSSSPAVPGVSIDTMTYERSNEEFPATFDSIEFNRNVASIDAYDIAVERGYSGSDNHRMVIKCSNMTIGSSNPNADSYAFSTGQGWGANCSVVLELDNSTVSGWGGAGADSNGLNTVYPGDGRDAIHAYIDLIVSGNETSRLTAGGSGGSNEGGISDCGGGGNGGNMTSSGAITPSRGGEVLYVFGGGLAGSPGEPGRITLGGAGYEDGASWGGDSGVPPSSLGFGGLGGNIVNTPSGGSVQVSWALSDGFTYGKNGLPEIVGSGVGHDIDFINAFDPPSFARTGTSGVNLEVGSIIEITGTYSNGTWVPSFYEANLWEVTAHFGAAEGSPNEQFEIKSYPDGDPLLVGEAGSGTNPSSGTLRFVDVTSSTIGPAVSGTL